MSDKWQTRLFPFAAAFLLGLAGCSGSGVQANDGASTAAREEIVEELFNNAVGLLNELDRYNPNDVLPQILGRLNQWIALRKPIAGWEVDPLLAKLPASVR